MNLHSLIFNIRIMLFRGIWFCLFVNFFISKSYAQFAISNGVSVPASDTLQVLIVFVEIDYSQGPCPGDFPDNFDASWPVENGKTLVPPSSSDYFDPVALSEPRGYITQYYHEASFGRYVLLGDYLPDVITVPCHKVQSGNTGLNLVLSVLDTLYGKETPLYSSHGFPLEHFDRWNMTFSGKPKIKTPDGRIDLLYIVWKNNRFLSGYHTGNAGGYGVTGQQGRKFKNMEGTNNVTSFNNAHGDSHGNHITIAEHLHGIFGGNHWHSAGGWGIHTFMHTPHTYGCTSQLGSTMQSVSGWDRWMMDWHNPGKQYLVSAFDTTLKEVDTENLTYTGMQGETLFLIRDHATTGDAVRLRLPCFDWQKKGDVKNQYLWLEYREMKSRFDEYLTPGDDCLDNKNGEYPRGTPGLYAYIQVGKDMKSGDYSITTTAPWHPNGCASWMFPLTAEGNYDFVFDYGNYTEGFPGCGSWGNASVPLNRRKSKSNPFTGYNDLYLFDDVNHDGRLYSGDTILLGLAEMKGDSVWFNFHMSGDWEDAFTRKTGYTELSIRTNPAPVPVYTYATDHVQNRFFFKKGDASSSFENRTIWLNGLSVKVVDEDILIEGERYMKVAIRWDDYTVKNSVRWCGNIVLSPHIYDSTRASLVLAERGKILLDRGLSPTFHTGEWNDKEKRWFFTDTTTFTMLPGARMELKKGTIVEVTGGSKWILRSGATLIMDRKSRIIIRPGATFVVEDGAKIIRHQSAKIKR